MISRTLFIKAYNEREAVRRRNEERRMRELTAETWRAFVDLVGTDDFGSDNNSPDVVVEGVTVTLWDQVILHTWTDYDTRFWAIEGKCPECGETCLSQQQKDLAGIGEMLVEFKPELDHGCKDETR